MNLYKTKEEINKEKVIGCKKNKGFGAGGQKIGFLENSSSLGLESTQSRLQKENRRLWEGFGRMKCLKYFEHLEKTDC